MKRGLLLFFTAACLLVYLTNCNKTNSVASAVLRVFNIDPTLQPQDMYLNGQVSAANLTYGSDTSYISIQPGTYNIKFAAAGSLNFNTDYNIDFTNGKNYLMFLFNNSGTVQSEAFDINPLALGIDTGEIRFFPFCPNAPLADIGIKNADTSKVDTTYTYYTNRYFNDVYANRTYTKFLKLPIGTYYIKFRYAGTTTAFDSLLLQVGDRRSYTIFTHGYYDSTGVPPFTIDTLQH
ncbi:MAG TPA: DUF4397 domain-containing protein [Chitinophagaceae bacterium]|nr:DUF4397 domain-containing protein [Chitinophagaceae bacterium]